MGMYDDVVLEMKCPKCGEPIDDFQSKDGDCILEKLQPYEINHCYSSCAGCGAWIDLRISERAMAMKKAAMDAMYRQLALTFHDYKLEAWFDIEVRER
jgi:hypothetical protein